LHFSSIRDGGMEASMSNVKNSSIIVVHGNHDTLKFNPNAEYQLISPQETLTRAQHASRATQSGRL
jgi:hypothetical protein